jgi:hypothetical protein
LQHYESFTISIIQFTMKSIYKIIRTLLIFVLLSSCQKEIISNNVNSNLLPPTADAGIPQTLLLPVSSATLNGTGISTNGPIVGYLWSLISGPNVPVIHSPSLPSTLVSGMIAGNYRFQFMVIDSAGLTGVDTTSIRVFPNQNPIQTLTLQPGNNTNEATLSWTNSGTTTGANFVLQELLASAWTTGGELFVGRGLFKFDLSSIPANATIISAKLSLYSTPNPLNGNQVDANFGTNNAMFIERVASNWNTTLNWPNQPLGDIATQISIPHTNLSTFDLIDIDVTGLTTSMITGNNYGFKIRLQNEVFYNLRNFCSSKHANTAKRPKLVISYQ